MNAALPRLFNKIMAPNLRNNSSTATTSSTSSHNNSNTTSQRSRPSFTAVKLNEQTNCILTKSKEISLSLLSQGLDHVLENKPVGMKLNKTFLAGILLRIITPSKELSQANVMRRYKPQSTTSNTATTYRSIYLFLNVSENHDSDQNSLFYMIMNSTSNTHLFERNTNFRDNGIISIGTLLLIVNPDPVENFLNGIPILSTMERAVVLNPRTLTQVPLSNNIEGNESRGFIYNNAEITLEKTSFIETKCSGLFCDRQRIDEVKSCCMCGCFSTKALINCIIAVWIMSFNTSDGKRRVVKDLSSLKAFQMFTKGKMSIHVRASMLSSGSRYYDAITDCMDEIVDYVNENGGWTIIGWGKKGLINDATLLGVTTETKGKEEARKVVADEVTTHVVQFYPTNRALLESDALIAMQFDLTQVH